MTVKEMGEEEGVLEVRIWMKRWFEVWRGKGGSCSVRWEWTKEERWSESVLQRDSRDKLVERDRSLEWERVQ